MDLLAPNKYIEYLLYALVRLARLGMEKSYKTLLGCHIPMPMDRGRVGVDCGFKSAAKSLGVFCVKSRVSARALFALVSVRRILDVQVRST
jgi:hypothetical protein